MHGEKIRWELYKDAVCYLEQEAAPHKTAAVLPLTFHLTNYPSKTKKICGEATMNSLATFYYRILHVVELVLADKQKLP